MTARSVNVVVPHTLGIAVAKDRVLTMLRDHQHDDPHIVSGDFAWNESEHRFTTQLTAYGAGVLASARISDTLVHVTTDEIAGFWLVVVIGVVRANTVLASMLTEALKP